VTIEEAIDILKTAAAYDQRTIGKTDAVAWHAVIGDLPFADAQQAVFAYYAESRERIMPADVRSRVKAMRRDRLAREVVPAPEVDPDSPQSYRTALAAMIRKLGDGLSVRRAIGGPVREGPPPEAFTAALEAMPKPPTKQELAAQQAAESRAGREALNPAADRKEPDDAGPE
jgi:hypothetical protein